MRYVADADLGYHHIRWRPVAGTGLELDVNYRAAHLPLLNPQHRDVIDKNDSGIYRSGRYDETRYSLVLPVSVSALEKSPVFGEIDQRIRSSSFADKMAWDTMEQRRSLLHATIGAGLKEAELADITARLEKHIAEYGLPAYRLGGPLIGQKNMGRIYFPVFPEIINGKNSFHSLQDTVGTSHTDIFLVGYYSLSDHLNVEQTVELAKILEQFASSTLLESATEEFWLLATNDDLVLSGTVRSRIGTSL